LVSTTLWCGFGTSQLATSGRSLGDDFSGGHLSD